MRVSPEAYGKAMGVRSMGYAVFVYNLANEPATQLLAVEDPAIEVVRSKANSDELVMIRNKWSEKDDPCCPSDQDVSSYQWDGTKFIEVR
jgi:hypothetical protein